MAKRGGCLTQSFRQMPNPPLSLVAVAPLRRTPGWTTPQCESTCTSRDVGLMRRDLSMTFWREKGRRARDRRCEVGEDCQLALVGFLDALGLAGLRPKQVTLDCGLLRPGVYRCWASLRIRKKCFPGRVLARKAAGVENYFLWVRLKGLP